MIKLASLTSTGKLTAARQIPHVSERDWTQGNKKAVVTLIEYGDYQCPPCGNYHPVLKRLNREFEGQILFVFRNFPLSAIHLNAELAARAAEAAGKQGRFWEMHDLLYEKQQEWSVSSTPRDIFLRYARSLNLDPKKFDEDLDSKEVRARVENDFKRGFEAGINSTPTFILNGAKIQTPGSYEEFRALLDKAIQSHP